VVVIINMNTRSDERRVKRCNTLSDALVVDDSVQYNDGIETKGLCEEGMVVVGGSCG
jgi:hypothetical protein